MAKKAGKSRKKKRNRQSAANADKKGIEAVGWGFWLICFALLLGPCWYLGYIYSVDDRKDSLLPPVIGFALAAVGAGLLSVVANFAVQKRLEIRQKRVRKGK